MRIALLGPEPEGGAADDHRYAEPLPHRQTQREQTEIVIGLAEIFGGEAEHPVTEDEGTADLAARPLLAGVQPEQHEQQQSLAEELIQLRGVPRLRAGAGEDHRPGQRRIGGSAPQFTVEEVADPAGSQPGRHRRDEQVGDLQERSLAPPGVHRQSDDHADRAAVEGHPALPDLEDVQRIRQIVGRLVEQAVAEPAAEDHPEDRGQQQVLDALPGPRRGLGDPGVRLVLQPAQQQPVAEPEADQVRQRVPVHGERSEPERDRIDLGESQHQGDHEAQVSHSRPSPAGAERPVSRPRRCCCSGRGSSPSPQRACRAVRHRAAHRSRSRRTSHRRR